ncbi:MAG: hypothetical protein JEZ03_02625 [Bacteroidales bacterium]|nr:hypothetical protein [Bacteroidales bacterium]
MENKHIFAELIETERALIENCFSDRKIRLELEKYGYSEKVFNEGRVLLSKAVDLIGNLQQEYGDEYEETKEIHREIAIANESFRKIRNIVRIALKNKPALIHYLGLNDKISLNMHEWVRQAQVFYSSLIANYEVVKELRRFHFSEDKIEAQKIFIEKIEKMKQQYDHELENGKSKTQQRDEMIEELKEWTEDLKDVARVAFENDQKTLNDIGVKM